MKIFRLSFATTISLLICLELSLIAIIPPLRYLFANLWDDWVVSIYGWLQLYYVWPLFIAFAGYLVFVYIMSREGWWRYGLNYWSIEVLDYLVSLPGVEDYYQSFHGWVSLWRPQVYKSVGVFLQGSGLITTEYLERKKNNTLLTMPPNRRYLVAVRSRLDRKIHNLYHAAEIEPANLESIARDRCCWQNHLLIVEGKAAPESIVSTLLLITEQFSVAYFLKRRFKSRNKSLVAFIDNTFLDELIKYARFLIASLEETSLESIFPLQLTITTNGTDQNIPAFKQFVKNFLLWSVGDSRKGFESLINLCKDLIMLGRSAKGNLPLTVFCDQFATLAIEYLFNANCFNEAIQLHNESRSWIAASIRALQEEESTESGVGGREESEQVSSARALQEEESTSLFAQFFANWFFDVLLESSDWQFRLAASSGYEGRMLILQEAWKEIDKSLPKVSVDRSNQKNLIDFAANESARRNRHSSQLGLEQEFLARRLNCLAGERQIPQHPHEALEHMRSKAMWDRLGMDLGDRFLLAAFGFVAGLCMLLIIAALYILQFSPPTTAWISDLRLAHRYNDFPITDGTLGGNDWLVLGTRGGGVEAYRRQSGQIGFWQTFTSENLQGALPSNNIVQVNSNQSNLWYLTSEGGLGWSSPDLKQWEMAIGQKGFSAAPKPRDIVASTLSSDKRFLGIATSSQVGLYDTWHHNWIWEQSFKQRIRAVLIWQQNRLVVGTDDGLFGYLLDSSQGRQVSVVPQSALSVTGINVKRFNFEGSKWLLAVTEKGGLLGLGVADSSWQWLIDDSGFTAFPKTANDIKAVSLDDTRLWLASGSNIGEYIFTSHAWRTSQPDASLVSSLTLFDRTMWAGTSNGLYSKVNDKWERFSQVSGGVKQSSPSEDRLWVLTSDGLLGSVDTGRQWQTAIGNTSFGKGLEQPRITDVVAVGDEFWATSSNKGVASYQWRSRQWIDRSNGLGNNVIKKLFVQSPSVWALTASDTNNVWFWANNTWRQIPNVTGKDIVVTGKSVWLHRSDDALAQLTPQGGIGETFLETTPFDSRQLRSVSYDDVQQQALLASAEGRFTYSLKNRSWAQIDKQETVDVAWGGGKAVWVTSTGGAFGESNLFPVQPDQFELDKFVTATVWQGAIWFSDGKQLARYLPGERSVEKKPFLPGVAIRQLRATANDLWILGKEKEQLGIYRYSDSGGWKLVSQSVDVSKWDVLSNSIIYQSGDGRLSIVSPSVSKDLFSGGFLGIKSSQIAVQNPANNSVWMLSLNDGVGCYIPEEGRWVSNSRIGFSSSTIAGKSDGKGNIFIVGRDKIYTVKSCEDIQTGVPPSISDESAYSISVLNNVVYVLFRSQNRLARYTGGRNFESVEVRSNDINSNLSPQTEMVIGNNNVWMRQGSFIVGYRLEGNVLVPFAKSTLPSSSDVARLFDGDNRNALYYGDGDKCWRLPLPLQLQDLRFAPCDSNPLAQLNDSYGHTWAIYPLSARALDDVEGNHFVSDRIRYYDLNGNILTLTTDKGSWQTTLSGDGSGWQNRKSVSAGNTPKPSITPIPLTKQDGWEWSLIADASKLEDQLSITSRDSPKLLNRRFENGRFADESATTVAFFDNRFWLGTRAGLFTLDSQANLASKKLVSDVLFERVRSMGVANNSLFVEFASGSIWQYQLNGTSGTWKTVTTIIPDPPSIKDDDEILFQETSRGVLKTPLLTEEKTPRFPRDRVFSIVATSDALWLSTSAGIWRAETGASNIKFSALPVLDPARNPSPAQIEMKVDQQSVFANFDKSFYLLEGDRWRPVSQGETPFQNSYQLIQISNTPLRWKKEQNGAISPWIFLGGIWQSIEWAGGQFTFDKVNSLVIQSNNLWLATQAGIYCHSVSPDGTINLEAIPSQSSTLTKPIVEIGVGKLLWSKVDDTAYYSLSRSGVTINSERVDDVKNVVVRSTVLMRDGKWESVSLPLAEPLVRVDALASDKAIFTQTGKFTFDYVNDATSREGAVVIASGAGILSYPQAPFTSISKRDTLWRNAPISRVAVEDNALYLLVDSQPYQVVNAELKAIDKSGLFASPGVVFNGAGWALSRGAIFSVAGLDASANLFTTYSKFVFDQVRRVVIVGADLTWLLTDAGWVSVASFKPNGGFERFQISTVSPSPDITRSTYTIEYVPGKILISPKNKDKIQIVSAADWLWQFDLPLWHRTLSPMIKSLDDPDAIWLVTKDGIYKIDKRRVGIQ